MKTEQHTYTHGPQPVTSTRHYFEDHELPQNPQPVDAVGVPLKVGDHVSWHIGGRDGSGHVFGFVTDISVYPRWNFGWEQLGEHEWRQKDPTPIFRVTVKPLLKGRKGVERDSDDLTHYITKEMYDASLMEPEQLVALRAQLERETRGNL